VEEALDHLNAAARDGLVALRVSLVAVLGSELVGVYLTGSATTREFESATSDLDVVVVTRGRLTPRLVADLRQMHVELGRQTAWGRRLEVEYAGKDQFRPDGIAGEAAFISPGEELRTGESVSAADDMLGVRVRGIALYGPPAHDVFPDVDWETFVASQRNYLADLFTRDSREPNATDDEYAEWSLNIARCLCEIETGALTSKRAATEWLAEQDSRVAPTLRAVLAARREEAGAATTARLGYRDLVECARSRLRK
jgi:predicted nucleotidyltransferase